MPTGRWTKELYHKDLLLPIIKVRTDSRKEPEWYEAFQELLSAVYYGISPHVNFAHVKTTVPRRNLPLRHEGQHMDLAYLTLGGTLVQLQFHVVQRRLIPEKYKGANLYREPSQGE